MSDVHGKYYSSDTASLEQFMTRLSDLMRRRRESFSAAWIIYEGKRDGGVYPVSEQASIVLDVLRECLQQAWRDDSDDCALTAAAEEKWRHRARAGGRNAQEIAYDRLILATGGKAAPVSGSDGSGYALAKIWDTVSLEPLPALVQLRWRRAGF